MQLSRLRRDPADGALDWSGSLGPAEGGTQADGRDLGPLKQLDVKASAWHREAMTIESHSVGFEPTTLGFGNLRSTVLN